jgi:UDP-glucose 4-epimerase
MDRQFKRIIVFGHTGFIGRNLLSYCKAKSKGIEVLGFSSSDVDLTQKRELERLSDLFDQDAAIIFCSALKRQLGDNLDSFSANMLMVENICRMLEERPVRRFVYFSSGAVYGEDVQHGKITEETPVQPTSFYGIGKFAAERLFWKTIDPKENSSLVILRPPTIYGPGDRGFPYGPSGFTHAAVINKQITLWGDGTELREFIYVADVVEITYRLVFSSFEGVLNLTSGKSYSFVDVLDSLGEHAVCPLNIVSRPRSKQKVDNVFVNDKLTVLFPDFTFTSLKKGIKRLFIILSREYSETE